MKGSKAGAGGAPSKLTSTACSSSVPSSPVPVSNLLSTTSPEERGVRVEGVRRGVLGLRGKERGGGVRVEG